MSYFTNEDGVSWVTCDCCPHTTGRHDDHRRLESSMREEGWAVPTDLVPRRSGQAYLCGECLSNNLHMLHQLMDENARQRSGGPHFHLRKGGRG